MARCFLEELNKYQNLQNSSVEVQNSHTLP